MNRVLRRIVERHIPLPYEPEFAITVNGKFVCRVDVAFVSHRVAIEADSYRWHLDRRSFENDRWKRNQLAAAGWTVLEFTWYQLTHQPHYVLACINAALVRSGAVLL